MAEPLPDTKVERHRNLLAIGIIAAVWILMVAITNPSGEFPLNDDWCYALSVRSLVEDGTFTMVSMVTMTLFTQVLWGALFCLPFGFSYTALRASTLVAGLGGLIGTYLLLRELGAGRRVAVICTLVVAVNPIYFSLSNTFMTDVPFYTLSVLSVYAFARALRRRSTYGYVAGTAIACLAALIRQSGLVLPIAFGVACLFAHGARVRGVVRACIPAVAVGGVLLAYQQWLSASGGLPEFYGVQVKNSTRFFTHGLDSVHAAYVVGLTACVYLGLFLFPLLVYRFVAARKNIWWIAGTAGLAYVISILIRPIGWRQGMPMSLHLGDIITPFGIGPFLLSDVVYLRIPSPGLLPSAFWSAVTMGSALGAALLLVLLFQSLLALRRESGSQDVDRPLFALMISGAALSLAPIMMLYFYVYYDRYFLAMIPFVMGMILLSDRAEIRPKRAMTAAVVAILVIGGILSVGMTHDYLAWNRARWAALDDLMAQGVRPSDIDGGYEFNGLYDYESRYADGWWRPIQEEYAITFGPIDGYDTVKVYPYRTWIPPREAGIHVMESWE